MSRAKQIVGYILFEKKKKINWIFFSKGCKPYNSEKKVYFPNKVTKYIYMALTNRSSNQIIKIKHFLILRPDDTHYNPVTKLIKIKHYLILCPGNTQ